MLAVDINSTRINVRDLNQIPGNPNQFNDYKDLKISDISSMEYTMSFGVTSTSFQTLSLSP